MRFAKSALTIALASALVGSAVLTASAPAAAATNRTATPGCVSLTNYTEVVNKIDTNISVTDPQPGTAGFFDDSISDPAGTPAGSATGTVMLAFKRPGDGHVIAYYWEKVTLTDGTFSDQGWADMTDEIAGGWVSFPATGTGGRYTGLTGLRRWRVTQLHKVAQVDMVLCARPGAAETLLAG